MKKKLLCVLICSSMCCSNAFAAINIEKDNCKYTVTADCDANEKVTMLVGKKDGDLSDSDIVAIREGTSTNKKITFEFEFEESSEYEGKYTVYVMNNENKVDFIHALNTSIAAATSALQSVAVPNGTEGLEELIKPSGIHRNALEAMGAKCEIYDECNNQQAVRDLFVAEKESADNLVQLLNNSIAVVMINSGDDLDSALLCATSNFENFSYEDFDDELKEWCKELIGGDYDTTEEFIERYNEICISYKFNNSKFSEFIQLFDEYSDALEITNEETYKKYDKLSKTDKMKVGEELVILLDKTPVKTSVELIETLDEAYQNVKEKKNDKPSGGPSGGGSGFGGGIILPGTVTVTPTQPGVENNSEIKYDDLQNAAWAETAINDLTKRGIVSGDGNGKFRPDDTITREEFAKMLITATGSVNEHAVSSFSDLDKNAWYYKYVASAYDAGIVSGISDMEFGVGKEITRQEMAVMAARALQTINKTPSKVETNVEVQDETPVIDFAPEIIDGKTVPGWGELSTTADSLNDVRVGVTDYDAKTGEHSLCAIFPNKNLATHNYYLTNTNVQVDLKAGQTYSVGVWYKVDSEIEEAFRAWTFFAVGSAESGVFELDTTEKETVDGWKHRYLVFTATENRSGDLYFGFCPNFSHVTDRTEVKILFDDIYFCEESRYFYKDDEASGANLVYNPSFEAEVFEFSDSDEIAEWAQDSVLSLYDRGIMSGTADGKFNPSNVATRAQAAVVVYNLIK